MLVNAGELTPAPAADVEVRGKSSKLFKAAALFASGVAATAAMMGPGAHKIADVIGDMQARGHQAKQVAPAAFAATAAQTSATTTVHAAPVMHETDRVRVEILSRPVPSDTRAAAEMARAVPLPTDAKVEMPSAEQTAVLAYGQFAPIATRVFNNGTKQNETHWTLHPWDVARLADQASAELYKERRIRVEPRLIAGAYYTESRGVVQVGFDRKGVELLNKGKSIDEVFRSGAKASYGLFQIDQQHAGATDVDPVRGAKKAAEFLSEGQANMKRYPRLGMVAVSATYNVSSNLREKIFAGAPLDEQETRSFEAVQNHAANMSYGAALYDVAHRTHQQHLAQAQKLGQPIAVAAHAATRADPLARERVDAVMALTGRKFQEPAAQSNAPVEQMAQTNSVPTALVATVIAPTPAPAVKAAAPAPSPVAAAARAPTNTAAQAPAATEAPAKAAATKPSLREAMKVAAAAPTHSKPDRAAPVRRSTEAAAPRTVSSTQDLDRFILEGAAREARAAAPERAIVVPSPDRARAAFNGSVNDWKESAASVLGRVAAFHEQRTREMAGQREAP
ncbi:MULTISPECIES: hypothetical protein [unclassified Variovorax]|uniref:hypothetical protein n=1 Tax=unclassified Variovorax TaxID=663243 RepID=UPI00076BE010|nr:MULTISPECIES: hypothetical protein [unclassified Variovorax]KWT69562.1 alginate regulatory protein AlgP [Variovorax sp. WDL1]PNG48880.1 hypothetical protein CHC06_06648 [Variovorax sp. B2]PNG49387.1 hypothetical protein CHC07_06296 [Variovorax sp. B4]VTV18312.1 hypothetical protein WDL1P2_00028 [Variovorax sp. WDL1]